jgi:hypothetical protein
LRRPISSPCCGDRTRKPRSKSDAKALDLSTPVRDTTARSKYLLDRAVTRSKRTAGVQLGVNFVRSITVRRFQCLEIAL